MLLVGAAVVFGLLFIIVFIVFYEGTRDSGVGRVQMGGVGGKSDG